MSTTSTFIPEPLAIETLIVDRSHVLNLSRPDLMRRASYKNIAKGLRRLDELLAGELNKTRGLIRALPAALEVPIEVVEHAIEQTRHRIAEAREKRGERACRAIRLAVSTMWDGCFSHRTPTVIATDLRSRIYAARHHPHRAKSATADLCRRFHRRRAAVAYRLRSCVGPSELRQQGSRRHSEQAIGIHERVRRKSRDPSRLRPPNWGDRELHPGSRRLVRSRRQPGRNVYARTLPGGHVHRAARKAGAAGNAASGHA